MSPRQYEDAPYPLMTVLGAVIESLDGRFKQVPNGRIEIAWRQARKAKGEAAPPRYFVGIEFAYVPDARDTLAGSTDERSHE